MIQRTDVDGVPTLLAARPGPLTAGLMFRVGRADETLARSGLTHLVEHLALHRHGLTDYHSNGSTGVLETHFYVRGSDAEVAGFLSGVCDSLGELPMERLETEKEILRTEEAGRGGGANRQLPLWRYGAQGYGLPSYPEWGLAQIGPEDVHRWVATWFTRENAALWIAGDHIPRGLRLRLRGGTRRALPRPSSALPVPPAYFASGGGKVVLDAVVHRTTEAAVATGVLERELFRALRQEGGLSYTTATDYSARGDGLATITAFADALPDKEDAVLGGFIDVLAKLRVGRIDKNDVDAVRAKALESASLPEADAARLPSYAADLLAGHPVTTVDRLTEELRSVTVAGVHEAVVEATRTALLQVPEGRSADWAGFTEAPTYSARAVGGTRYASRDGSEIGLVAGPEGVSLVDSQGAVTVRFNECAAKLGWPDGARRLIGFDGMVVHIEPSLFEVGPDTLAAIDAGTHPMAAVWMPERHPEAIPRPDARRAAHASASRSRLEPTVLIVCTVLTTLWTVIALITTFATATDKTLGTTATSVTIAVVWGVELLLAAPIIKIMRRRRN